MADDTPTDDEAAVDEDAPPDDADAPLALLEPTLAELDDESAPDEAVSDDEEEEIAEVDAAEETNAVEVAPPVDRELPVDDADEPPVVEPAADDEAATADALVAAADEEADPLPAQRGVHRPDSWLHVSCASQSASVSQSRGGVGGKQPTHTTANHVGRTRPGR